MDGKGIGWHPYDDSAAQSMTKFFGQWCTDTAAMAEEIECVFSGHFHYLVNFKNMVQKNIKTNTSRPIRCVF
jgi:hypothetical protein